MLKKLLLLAYATASIGIFVIRIVDVRFFGDILFAYPPDVNGWTVALYLSLPGFCIGACKYANWIFSLAPAESDDETKEPSRPTRRVRVEDLYPRRP